MGKAEKLQQAAGGSSSKQAKAKTTEGEADASAGDLLVECAKCSLHFPWEDLAPGDGVCSSCLGTGASSGNGGSSSSSTAAPAMLQKDEDQPSVEELMVECQSCGTLTPWRWIEVHDGICPSCYGAPS